MRLVSVLLFACLCAASGSVAGAATPDLSQSVTPTGTSAVTDTFTAEPSRSVVATTTPGTGTPTPQASPSPAPANFRLSGHLVIDINSNGVADSTDKAPLIAFLSLMPWSTADLILAPTPVVPPSVELYSAPDGSFSFEDVLPDSYTLEIVWFGRFVTKGAMSAAPTLWRAAIHVTDKGEVAVPDPLPEYWPGSLVPLIPEEPVLGTIPDPILLKNVDPNIVTVPVFDAGPAGPPPVGRVDVAAALQRQRQLTPRLPATGVASSSHYPWPAYLLLGVASLVLLSLAALLVHRARA